MNSNRRFTGKTIQKRVDADYLTERDGKPLDESYFKNLVKDMQSKSDDALKLVSILVNNPPMHRF